MADLVQLEQQLLAHDLECAHLLSILLLGKKHLAVATLANLGQDLEVSLSQSDSPLAQIGAFPTCVFGPHLVICLLVRLFFGVLGLESSEAVLSRAYVGKKVKVVVEEVYIGVRNH